MAKLYRDYIWKGGIPYGVEAVETLGYKIAMDPYRKRICIERYTENALPEPIYDSALLDFRHLKQPELAAWQKSLVSESDREMVCLIRDQNDRLLFIEKHLFQDDLCRACRVTTLHGISLSTHCMFYTALGDPFDGVVLYDAHEHPVMVKRYQFDEASRQFTQLLEEAWDLQHWDAQLRALLPSHSLLSASSPR